MPLRADYPLYPDALIEGQIVDSFPHDIITLSNSAAAIKQVDTIAPGTAANSTAYNVAIDGVTATYTSDADATAAEIQAGLIAALKATAAIYGKVIPTAGASNAIVLTARKAGSIGGFTTTLSGGSTGYALTNTTAAGEPAIIPFGRAVTTATGEVGCKLIAAAPSTTNIVRGVAIRTNVFESQGVGLSIVEGYPAREAVNVMRRGRVAVRVLDAVSPQSQVWVQHTGVDAGKFRGATNANATALTSAAGKINEGFSFATVTAAGGLAILEINLS